MLQNRELRQFTGLFLCISAVTILPGFWIDPRAGILILISDTALGTVFFAFTRARYKSIARISEEIDLVLHNADHLYISEFREGELSVLQSEITKMTLRIREQNDALRREKEYLSDSLADIAHQLRTPLTSAHLILSLLEKEPDEKEQKLLLRETEELFAQMEWLINSLLKLSRLDAGIAVFKREEIEVKCLINCALHPLLIPMELHAVSVHTEIPEGMTILGDLSWLSEALQNILKNCMQSIGDNGRIEVICRDTLLFEEILIHDSGPGFEKDDLPRLFERFYRGKNDSAVGFGIGLALCKRIITEHEGTIIAKNHPQGGAVFRIRFSK